MLWLCNQLLAIQTNNVSISVKAESLTLAESNCCYWRIWVKLTITNYRCTTKCTTERPSCMIVGCTVREFATNCIISCNQRLKWLDWSSILNNFWSKIFFFNHLCSKNKKRLNLTLKSALCLLIDKGICRYTDNRIIPINSSGDEARACRENLINIVAVH